MNFEANSNLYGVYPPDTTGDVGPEPLHPVGERLASQIYNKTGTTLYGPAAGNTLWTGFGGAVRNQQRRGHRR